MKFVEFLDKFEDIVLSEQKEKTTRLITTEDFCYYSTFMYKSHMFEITNVERMSTRMSCDTYHTNEMFNTSDDMYDELKRIYKEKVTEESECFVISFKKIY
jgi:hypothetical protein